ncbi:hypothetical protein AYX14_07158 [Cryptococcus neoformans]|nr:hypothetical protein AYX14_07158 [Cryptococcus neoformans var. grubii]
MSPIRHQSSTRAIGHLSVVDVLTAHLRAVSCNIEAGYYMMD